MTNNKNKITAGNILSVFADKQSGAQMAFEMRQSSIDAGASANEIDLALVKRKGGNDALAAIAGIAIGKGKRSPLPMVQAKELYGRAMAFIGKSTGLDTDLYNHRALAVFKHLHNKRGPDLWLYFAFFRRSAENQKTDEYPEGIVFGDMDWHDLISSDEQGQVIHFKTALEKTGNLKAVA